MNSIEKEISEIKMLAKAKDAIILAHFYQREEIQEIADFVGDSLALAKKAVASPFKLVVVCGVKFMAETVKILCPEKKVLYPDEMAGCSLADSCGVEDFLRLKELHKDAITVTYINSSVEIKALSDIICTSSNAKKIIQAIPLGKKIIFSPDKNLGSYLSVVTGRKLITWEGACHVHEKLCIEKTMKLKERYPNAKVLVHPEANSELREMADFVGSTSELILFISSSDASHFLIGTEVGIFTKMNALKGDKKLIPIPIKEPTECACSECEYMKLNTLEKIKDALINESPNVIIDRHIQIAAQNALIEMLKY